MIIIKRFRMTKDHYIYLDQIQNKEFSRLPRSALYDCLPSHIFLRCKEQTMNVHQILFIGKRPPMTVTD